MWATRIELSTSFHMTLGYRGFGLKTGGVPEFPGLPESWGPPLFMADAGEHGSEEMPVLFCINRKRKIPSMDEENEWSEIRGTRAGVIYLDIVWKDMV